MSVRLRRFSTMRAAIVSVYVGWYVKLTRDGGVVAAAALGPIPGVVVVIRSTCSCRSRGSSS